MQKSTLRIVSTILPIVFLMAAPSFAAPFASSKGYKITPPPGWKVKTSGIMGADFVAYTTPVNGFAPNINVVVVKAIPNQDLAAGGEQLTQTLQQQFTDYNQIWQHVTKLNGLPALETVATYAGSQGNTLRMHQVIEVTKKFDYVFTLTGDETEQKKYEAAFIKSMQSVKYTSH